MLLCRSNQTKPELTPDIVAASGQPLVLSRLRSSTLIAPSGYPDLVAQVNHRRRTGSEDGSLHGSLEYAALAPEVDGRSPVSPNRAAPMETLDEKRLNLRSLAAVCLAVLFLVVCTLVQEMPGFQGNSEARRCLGLLLFVATLWAANPIPAHVTALFVPFLTVLLRVCRVPSKDDSGTLVPYALHNRTAYPGGTSIPAPQVSLPYPEPHTMITARWCEGGGYDCGEHVRSGLLSLSATPLYPAFDH